MTTENTECKIVVIDCQTAGVAGDMFLGALLDLGANVDRVTSAIKTLENPAYGYHNIQIKIDKVMRREFKATQIDVTAESTTEKDGQELVAIVEKTVQALELSEQAKQFASKTVQTLIKAEASVHGNLADAHLHEVGLVDTAAEIVGCAVALEDLGLFGAKFFATPVSVGGGTIKFSHGIVPSPAPATLAILETSKFPFKGGPVESELATPTGAAILVNLAREVNAFYPALAPLKVGYGAGTKEFPQMPNVLRITVGKAVEGGLLRQEIAVLETNVDDVTGEVVGYTLEKLLSEGAKDVSVTPMFTKKNRTGQIIKVIAEKEDVERLSRVLMEQTGTLGVRVMFCERHIFNREVQELEVFVNSVKQIVKVKVAKDRHGRMVHVKPEYEDVKRIADAAKVPFREVADIVMAKAREVYQ
jgi:uncharacterized protein (TIGR00299 family) protein